VKAFEPVYLFHLYWNSEFNLYAHWWSIVTNFQVFGLFTVVIPIPIVTSRVAKTIVVAERRIGRNAELLNGSPLCILLFTETLPL